MTATEAKLDRLIELVSYMATRLEAVEAALLPISSVPAAATFVVTNEAERQRDLYAAKLAKFPHEPNRAELDYKFRPELRHPDLALLSPEAMSLRSDGGWDAPAVIYNIAPEDRIKWHGGLIRRDGGNGMYATQSQADAWDDRVADGTNVGPG